MSTSWTFGPTGAFTATWDGSSQVTVTQTAGGQFVVSFAAQSLSAALASPDYQAILAPPPNALLGLTLVASTGTSGFALQNATPTILSWTAPNDGQMHRVYVFTMVDVTSAETGGDIWCNGQMPDGGAFAFELDNGAFGTTGYTGSQAKGFIVKPGTAFAVYQAHALTAGAAKLWAEIWAA